MTGRRRTKGEVDVDQHVGGRIRLRRTLLGMSQIALGQAIGLTFQQVQKYESGANRVSASKLWQLVHVLDVPISFFFDGLEDGSGPASVDESPADRLALELMRAVGQIEDHKARSALLDLAQSLCQVREQRRKAA